MNLAVREAGWRRRLTFLSLATVLVAVPALWQSPERTAHAAAANMTWNDEFDGPAGSAPDGGKWGRDIGGGGWGNSEREYYTNSTRNASLTGDGKLAITARSDDASQYQCWYGTCRYTSARLLTSGKFTQKYGRFEASIKIPRGGGIWPAFWMLGDDIGSAGWPSSGEIDAMENIGREPNVVHGTIHGPGYSGGAGPTAAYTNPGGAPFADGYHVFAVDWSPSAITWSVDGVAYSTKTPASANGNKWVFDHPFFIILNVAVGGAWPGEPDGSLQMPQQMLVDYVRVYSQGGGTPNPPPPTGNSRLNAGQRLTAGQGLTSPNGRFHLNLQTDGNLVIYDGSSPIWATGTWNLPADRKPTHADMQGDGNFVLYSASNQAAWAAGVWGSFTNPHLDMQDDGNLVIYHNGQTPLWASGTAR